MVQGRLDEKKEKKKDCRFLPSPSLSLTVNHLASQQSSIQPAFSSAARRLRDIPEERWLKKPCRQSSQASNGETKPELGIVEEPEPLFLFVFDSRVRCARLERYYSCVLVGHFEAHQSFCR